MTKPTFVMATICLNLSYGQIKEKSTVQNQLQLYKYGFSGYQSGNKPGFKIKKEVANGGKTIIVRNYTVEQLFAIAYGAGAPMSKEQIIVEVMEPKKLLEIRCYKLFVPQHQMDGFYTIMQQNLNMEFSDYIITVEKRGNVNCMIIKDVDG
nr:hypothetical protein [uncultured Pedobacter sp.]